MFFFPTLSLTVGCVGLAGGAKGWPDQFQFSDFVVENPTNKFPKREERQTAAAAAAAAGKASEKIKIKIETET